MQELEEALYSLDGITVCHKNGRCILADELQKPRDIVFPDGFVLKDCYPSPFLWVGGENGYLDGSQLSPRVEALIKDYGYSIDFDCEFTAVIYKD